MDYSAAFERFWAAYPSKQNKSGAFKSWQKKKLDSRADELIDHVTTRARSDKKWLDGFIPMGSTFINQQRWEDEYQSIHQKVKPIPVESPMEHLEWMERVDTDRMRAVCMATWHHWPPYGPIRDALDAFASLTFEQQNIIREKYGTPALREPVRQRERDDSIKPPPLSGLSDALAEIRR